MIKKFNHFLIIRFNIPFEGWESDKSKNPVRTGEWIKKE
jgi:hypothetical protein